MKLGGWMFLLLITACSARPVPEVDPSTATTDTAAAVPAAEAPKYRLLASGQYGAAANGEGVGAHAPFILVARTPTEFERIWKEQVGETPLPSVDFDRERAVFLLAGSQRSGGYAIEFRSGDLDGDSLVVEATFHRPEPGTITTQVITAPYAVLAVRDRSFSSVQWVDAKTVIARTDLALPE
jgi:hypothetical protein